MKKLLIILLGIFFSFKATCQPSADTLKYNKNAVKLDIFYPTIGIASGYTALSLEYERYIKSCAIQIEGIYFNINKQQAKRESYQGIVDFKYYLKNKKKPPIRYYLGGYGKLIKNHSFEQSENEFNNSKREIKEYRCSYGILNGVQIFLNKRFTFDFLFGAGYSNSINRKVIYSNYTNNEHSNNVDLRAGIAVGLLF